MIIGSVEGGFCSAGGSWRKHREDVEKAACARGSDRMLLMLLRDKLDMAEALAVEEQQIALVEVSHCENRLWPRGGD